MEDLLFEKTLAKAAEVFGSMGAAERWMGTQVMGRDGQRPIELLPTTEGAQLVNDFVCRLEYGVYT